MMFALLAKIVEELNFELNRLNSLRTIVAGLASPCVTTLNDQIGIVLSDSEVLAPAILEDAVQTRPPDEQRYTRRSTGGPVVRRARRPRAVEIGAIASTVPSGPVAVSVATLKQQRRMQEAKGLESQNTVQTVQPLTAEDSNELARTLASRWLRG